MVERAIIDKLNSLRESHMTYRGYTIEEDRDGYVIVSNSKGRLGQFESIDAAQDYIDDLQVQYKSSPSSLRYYVKIAYTSKGEWNILSKNGHYISEKYITSSNIRTFDSKNKAEQALKNSTRNINYVESKIDIYK